MTRRLALLHAFVCIALLLPAPAGAEPPPEQGFHYEPHLGFSHGDHHVDLLFEFRYRWEDWQAIALLVGGFHRAGDAGKAQQMLKRLRPVPGLPEQAQLGAIGEIQMQLDRLEDAAAVYTEMLDKGLQPEMALSISGAGS